jgi:hypothetical protein
LQLQELEAVKEVVKEHEPEGVNEIGLTEVGKDLVQTQPKKSYGIVNEEECS